MKRPYPKQTSTLRGLKQSGIEAYTLSNSLVVDKDSYILHTKASLDNSKIVASLSDFSIVCYDARNGLQACGKFRGHSDRIRDIVTTPSSPDGSCFFSCSEDKRIYGWDARAGEKAVGTFSTIDGSSRSEFGWCSMDIGCSGNLIGAGSDAEDDSTVYFFDVRSSKVLGKYSEAHTDAITQVLFNPLRNTELLTGSLDGLICFFDICKQGEEEALQSVMNVEDPVQKLGYFGPSLQCLYCLTHSETFSLHHIEKSECMATFPSVRDHVRSKSKGLMNPEFLVDCFYTEGSLPHSWNFATNNPTLKQSSSPKSQSLILISGDHHGKLHMNDVTLKGINPLCQLSNPFAHSACVRAVTFMNRDPKTGVPARFISGGEDGRISDWKHGELTKTKAGKSRSRNRHSSPRLY
mmetsp:Transcript_5142/g.6841  ORF Transcript_5142/g.6841 Transcript_5142/m.6841 type:complete len:407 (+) Transcript_5142:40-1260(+)|eukprot:CAMPEP_0184021570 /NCGR_PEP_ID=MMETSP0954-20121128/10014_1 /TAXON_ID=627963 /ORGANISM="Aplanochytrium sp, Strain PBS07" /LENGTH=406 /DNA_ID=CAMNT_0026303629 /DNA_START=101 /DNA_END=1321 /DNA_ORIENTATION=-